MKKLFKWIIVLFSILTLAPSVKAEEKEIIYGKGPGAYTELFEKAIIPIVEKEGYKFKVFEVSDVLQNDIGLQDGDIDVNVEQHLSFLESFNDSHNADLVAITPIPTVPAGIFSAKHKTLDEISENSRIAIPNDATDPARAYTLLEKAGWIKLKEGVSFADITQKSIVDNPYNLKFEEIDPALIPRTLDEFDYAVIDGSTQYRAKLDSSTALLQEDVQPNLTLQVVVRKEDKDKDWVQAIKKAYQSQELRDYINKNEKGKWFIPNQE